MTDHKVTFRSNVNRDGDTYEININGEIVSSGIIENGKWVEIKK
jgi:hypothetical protein